MEQKIICNACGKEILIINGIPQEDYLHINKGWGYFSKKDGDNHEMNLCEDCYDGICVEFVKPVCITEVTELI